MSKKTITIAIDEELLKKLETLAKDDFPNVDFYINQCLRKFLRLKEEIEKIEEKDI
jgi:metal-responsive CopG/Arc/MetJ family transcriptional regulator